MWLQLPGRYRLGRDPGPRQTPQAPSAQPVNDSWIAACCVARGLPLVTFNIKNYADFAGATKATEFRTLRVECLVERRGALLRVLAEGLR